jgi:hypothetical protein
VGGLERVHKRVPEPRQKVAVAVERHGDVLVPEPVLDRLGVRARSDQQRRARVAEVVEADAVLVFGEGGGDGWLEVPPIEVGVPDRRANLG